MQGMTTLPESHVAENHYSPHRSADHHHHTNHPFRSAMGTAHLVTPHAAGELSTASRIDAAWASIGSATKAATVVLACAAVGLAAWWTPVTAYATATGLAIAVLVVAAMVDVVERRLPNGLVALAGIPVLAGVTAAWLKDEHVVGSAAIGAGLMAAPLLVTHLVSPSAMGFGDVKAGAVLGAAIGLIDDDLALPTLLLALLLVSAFGLVRRARTAALGPPLVFAAIVILAVARATGWAVP